MLRLDLGTEGFARLAAALDATLAEGPDDGLTDLGPGLYGPSLFLRARGDYHALRTCNHWAGRLLSEAGLPTAPVLDTLSGGLLLDLRLRAARPASE